MAGRRSCATTSTLIRHIFIRLEQPDGVESRNFRDYFPASYLNFIDNSGWFLIMDPSGDGNTVLVSWRSEAQTSEKLCQFLAYKLKIVHGYAAKEI